MKNVCLALALVLLAVSCRSTPVTGEITFPAADGVTVYADSYVGARSGRPLILLFHQGGGDARGEYGPLIPWLRESGYDVIAVDLRLGGDRFGGTNRTAAGVAGKEYSYCDAYQDILAAVRYARETLRVKPVVWGSSYSAALVIKLAAEHPDDVMAVLAFSPAGGPPMKGCDPTPYIEKVEAPMIAFRPPQEMEMPHVRAQAEVLRTYRIELHVPEKGTHGSSMLVPERVEGPVGATREVVLAFLRNAVRAR